MSLDTNDVKELMKAFEASSFDELVLETDDMKFVIRRRGAGPACGNDDRAKPAGARPLPAPLPAPAREPESPGIGVTSPSAAVRPAQGADGTPLVDIKAPMLGTFYAAPKPGAPPFISIGSRINEGGTIAIIEVMKLMNSVCSTVSGEVVEICAKDGELVEYGQVLFRVRQGA